VPCTGQSAARRQTALALAALGLAASARLQATGLPSGDIGRIPER
jgi:hypothetical protein